LPERRLPEHAPASQKLIRTPARAHQSGGPLYLEITGLPSKVHLLSKHGTVHAHRPMGSPFMTEAPAGLTLPPGVTVGFLLRFSGKANFGVRVLAGPGAV
jgi:hypothetical protein